MAEPLTSSDIIREQLGFGPTSPDEKRRALGAGISPLGTMERIRFEEGRGISPMDSKSDRDAWVAAEVLAGRRDPLELPKSYGGLGERPEATTRRQFRMQQEWDKKYAMAKAEEDAARKIEESDRDYALRLQDQELRIESENRARDAALAKAAREAKVQNEARRVMSSIVGSTLPDGTKLRPINIEDEDAVERLQRVAYMNDFGMEDPFTKEIVTTMINDANRIREKRVAEIASENKATTEAKISLVKDLAANGLSIAEFSKDGVVDFEAANTALGEAMKKRGEIEEERKDEREIARSLRRQKAAAETELVKIKSQVGRFEKLRPTANNLQELEAARVSQGIFEDEINRINRELGVEPQPPTPTPTGQRPALGDIFGGQ